jgi:hypothetical protein
MIQDCMNLAENFCDYAVLVQTSARSFNGGASGADSSGVTPALGDSSSELLRLFEVIMTSQLQKVVVLLQARNSNQKLIQSLKPADWQQLVKFTNDNLDKMKSVQEQCKQALAPKDPITLGDVRSGMRSMLYMQTKNVVAAFHEKRTMQVKEVLKQERWERTDVPLEYKQFLEQLVGSQQQQSDLVAIGDQGNDRFLRVDSVNYLVIPAALTLVELLVEYLNLCRDFDSLGAEIVGRMIELLRLFNSETNTLILKGQAVTKQTLRKITAANLALCSQCCGLVAQVLPKVQTNVLAVLQGSATQSSGALSRAVAAMAEDFVSVATEFSDHRTALLGKLSDLLRERYDVTAKRWLSTPHPEALADSEFWSAAAAPAAAAQDAIDLCPHDALGTAENGLVKDFCQMYRVLLKNLNGDIVRKIFATAFDDIAVKFEQRLTQEMTAPSPPYTGGPGCSLGDRLIRDIAYLREQLAGLGGIGAPLNDFILSLSRHLQIHMPPNDPNKAIHRSVLEALQRVGRLPPPS